MNPILPVHAADPHLILFGDRYYLYATDAGIYDSHTRFHAGQPGPEGAGFAAWSSPDLVDWRSEGRILSFSEVGWARGLDWAPAIIKQDGRYYLYFCADSSIGVAVGDTPLGPFCDPLGKPLVPFQPDLSSIDPMAFIDDDGQAYLYYGAVPASWRQGQGFDIGTSLSVRKLRPDMISFEGLALPTIDCGSQNGPHIEASFVIKRMGIYYLMWSQGSWEHGRGPQAYHVRYAMAASPLGPWTVAEQPVILAGQPDIDIQAPGHHSLLNLPNTDDWVCAYHMHRGTRERLVCLDMLEFEPDGRIRLIIPTRAGVPPRPILNQAAKARIK